MGSIIGVGSALVDELAFVPESFVASIEGRKGGTELVPRDIMGQLLGQLLEAPTQAPGGSAANTVVGAARLGIKAAMLAKIGDDEAGRFYREAMNAPGVSQHAFKLHPDAGTGTCLSLITPDSQRTMRTYLGAAADLAPADITVADFAGYTHAHVEGYQLFNRELMVRVLQCAKQAGCTVSMDVNAPEVIDASRDILPDLLDRYVDMVFANEDEAAAFAGTADEAEGLNALARHCDIAVLKLGKRGALIRRDGETVAVSAQLVDALDTTGAGDLWASGFLAGILSGRDLADSGYMGAMVAAEVVQITGASIPAPTWTDLRTKLSIA